MASLVLASLALELVQRFSPTAAPTATPAPESAPAAPPVPTVAGSSAAPRASRALKSPPLLPSSRPSSVPVAKQDEGPLAPAEASVAALPRSRRSSSNASSISASSGRSSLHLASMKASGAGASLTVATLGPGESDDGEGPSTLADRGYVLPDQPASNGSRRSSTASLRSVATASNISPSKSKSTLDSTPAPAPSAIPVSVASSERLPPPLSPKFVRSPSSRSVVTAPASRISSRAASTVTRTPVDSDLNASATAFVPSGKAATKSKFGNMFKAPASGPGSSSAAEQESAQARLQKSLGSSAR